MYLAAFASTRLPPPPPASARPCARSSVSPAASKAKELQPWGVSLCSNTSEWRRLVTSGGHPLGRWGSHEADQRLYILDPELPHAPEVPAVGAAALSFDVPVRCELHSCVNAHPLQCSTASTACVRGGTGKGSNHMLCSAQQQPCVAKREGETTVTNLSFRAAAAPPASVAAAAAALGRWPTPPPNGFSSLHGDTPCELVRGTCSTAATVVR